MLTHPQTKESKMKRLWKSIAFFVIANMIALASAHAGDNSCAGEISIDKDWVHISGDNAIPPMPCKAKLNSATGRRILAKCPVGTKWCEVHMPLEGSARDKALDQHGNRLPITKIDVIHKE
jgi:hypothetical protein